MVCPFPAPPHTPPPSSARISKARFIGSPCALMLLAVACGGAASEPAAADSPDGPVAEGNSDVPPAEGSTPSEPARQCTDGSCFDCGSGLCPTGFYCDEGAIGGAACSWVPDCPREPSCACIARELGSNCQCEERDGGVYVRCS